MYSRAIVVVQGYYALMTYYFANHLWRLPEFLGRDAEGFTPQWPIAWIHGVGLDAAIPTLAILVVTTALAGIVFWRRFWARLLVCLTALQLMSLSNSWGGINHNEHELFWVSVCFLFLPSRSRDSFGADRTARMQTLTAVAGAMGLILMFYSLSGFFKVWDGLEMLWYGQHGGLAPYAMATTLATRQLATDTSPLFSWVILDYPLVGWPMYLGIYYAELVAFIVLFRPALHILWGVGLILFHFGTIAFMDIAFPYHIALNALLFVWSPFVPVRHNVRSVCASLPIFGLLFRRGLGWRAE